MMRLCEKDCEFLLVLSVQEQRGKIVPTDHYEAGKLEEIGLVEMQECFINGDYDKLTRYWTLTNWGWTHVEWFKFINQSLGHTPDGQPLEPLSSAAEEKFSNCLYDLVAIIATIFQEMR